MTDQVTPMSTHEPAAKLEAVRRFCRRVHFREPIGKHDFDECKGRRWCRLHPG